MYVDRRHVRYGAVLYRTVLLLYGTVPQCAIRYDTVPYQCCIVPYFTVLYCTMRYGTCTVLYRTVLGHTAMVYADYLYHIELMSRIRLISSYYCVPSTSHVFMTHYAAVELPKRSLPAAPMRFPWAFNTQNGYNTKEQPGFGSPGIV